jgi:hypothetical protein
LPPPGTDMPSVHFSIPVAAAVDPQEAVIAKILASLIAPSEADDKSAITFLEASKWTDTTVLALNRHNDHYLTQVEKFVGNGDRLNTIKPSDVALDRLCAAWIAWRTKHYAPPSTGEEGLGNLDDHPF